MVNNTYVRSKRAELKDQLRQLAIERKQAEMRLKKIGLTENQKYKEHNLPEDIRQYRRKALEELADIERRQMPIKKQYDELGQQQDHSENKIIRQMLKEEIFSQSQWYEMINEMKRRLDGQEPLPLGLNYKDLDRYKDGYYEYRDLAREQIETMIDFRVMLTGLIEKGCEQFGKAEFLKFISPLNKKILPVQELSKAKTKFLL